MNKPGWEDAPEWAQWLAMDQDGEWYWFEHRPHSENYTWQSNSGRLVQDGYLPSCRDLDWRETLEQRPESDIMRSVSETRAALERAGATKHDADKPRMDLLDPAALEEVAKVLGFGAQKYAAHNWRKGIAYSRLLAAALRHIFAMLRGEDRDPESGLFHSAHAMCCLMFLINMQLTRPDLDDRHKASDER